VEARAPPQRTLSSRGGSGVLESVRCAVVTCVGDGARTDTDGIAAVAGPVAGLLLSRLCTGVFLIVWCVQFLFHAPGVIYFRRVWLWDLEAAARSWTRSSQHPGPLHLESGGKPVRVSGQGATGGGTDAAAAFRSLLLLLGGRGRWRTLALGGLGMGVVSGCTPWRIKCRRSAVLRSFHLFLIGEYHQPSCASSVGVRRSHWLQQLSSPGMHAVGCRRVRTGLQPGCVWLQAALAAGGVGACGVDAPCLEALQHHGADAVVAAAAQVVGGLCVQALDVALAWGLPRDA
jgi:hypothetical protein